MSGMQTKRGEGSEDQYPGPKVYPPRGLGLGLPVRGRGCAKVTNHTTKYKYATPGLPHNSFATIKIHNEFYSKSLRIRIPQVKNLPSFNGGETKQPFLLLN